MCSGLCPSQYFHYNLNQVFCAKQTFRDYSRAQICHFFRSVNLIFVWLQELNQDTTITASNGKEFPAMRLFSYALRFFRDHALKELTSQSSVTIDNDDVRWVITVPAIWKAPAKQFMRQAAYQVRRIYKKNNTR